MANALPILLLGGAAVMLIAGGKKKKKQPPTTGARYTPAVPPPPPVKTKGSSSQSANRAVWKDRQTLLAYLAEAGICAACHPGTPDGIYGENTRRAVLAFQTFAGIERTGKWNPQTETAMQQAIRDLKKIMEDQPPPTSEDECDPLDPDTWGAGNICVHDGRRWIRAPEATGPVKPDRPTTPGIGGGYPMTEPCDPDGANASKWPSHHWCFSYGNLEDLRGWFPKNVVFRNAYVNRIEVSTVPRPKYKRKVRIDLFTSDAPKPSGWYKRQIDYALMAMRTLGNTYSNIEFVWISEVRKEKYNLLRVQLMEPDFIGDGWHSEVDRKLSFQQSQIFTDANLFDIVAREIESEW